MQLAQILEPEDNLSYVIQKFQENLVETCEDLKSNAKEVKDLEGKINKILAGDKKKKVDAHAFIEYVHVHHWLEKISQSTWHLSNQSLPRRSHSHSRDSP